jgi:hypothetical protein
VSREAAFPVVATLLVGTHLLDTVLDTYRWWGILYLQTYRVVVPVVAKEKRGGVSFFSFSSSFSSWLGLSQVD